MTKLGYLDFFAEHNFETGLLGIDIRDMVVRELDGETYLYTSTSMGGGLTAYRLNADGIPELIDMESFSGASRIPVLHGVNIVTINGSDFLLVGSHDSHALTGYRLAIDGGIGRRHSVEWGPVDTGATHIEFMTIAGHTYIATASENGTGISVFEMTDDGTSLTFEISDPTASTLNTVAAMSTTTISGTTYLLTASTQEDEVISFRVEPSGQLTQVDTFGSFNGLGISAPTGLEIVTVGGENYVILASSVSDSLSVLRVSPDGSLTAVDHVIDTLNTRFENIGEMTTFTANGHVFVLVSGTDDGLSLLTLLPNGRLHHIESIPYNGANGLNSISALEVVDVDGTLQVFVASGTGDGLFQFEFDTSDLGEVRLGSAASETVEGTGQADVIEGRAGDDIMRGYNGDDILVDGLGADTFWGGNGADTFVMVPDNGSTDIVMDFERGTDRMDLSNFGMLYSVSQISVIPTSYGARVTFRDEVFDIHSNDGYSLNADDIFGASFLGPDRPYLSLYNELIGTSQADHLVGGTGTDIIRGHAANDSIWGGFGDDILEGGDGNDVIDGGAGNDHIEGGDSNDTITGGSGDDWIIGGRGADTVTMGSGNDRFIDGTETGQWDLDTVYGNAGNDVIEGGGGNDTFSGGSGNDTIWGGLGADTITGDSGHDTLRGGNGDDAIHGGTGNDVIAGQVGADTINGGDGNDQIDGGSHYDTIYAGSGDDSVIGGLGSDTIWLQDGDDVFHDNMQMGAHGRDSVHGGDGNDRIEAGGGNDRLWGDAGNDTLNGRRGDDTIYGGDGNDRITADVGNDEVHGGAGYDTIYTGPGNDRVYGGLGNDRIWLGPGGDVFSDSSQTGIHARDFVHGGDGNDSISAGGGNDTLWGDNGHDTLAGEHGADVLRGGNGDDTLIGGAGNDSLTGGFGRDTFVFRPLNGVDVINDFNPSLDTVTFDVNGLNYADLSWGMSANNNLLVFYTSGRIEFTGLDMSDMSPSWFDFG